MSEIPDLQIHIEALEVRIDQKIFAEF